MALDFGAQEFVDLDNDTLEDAGGVDLVFDVSAETSRSGLRLWSSRRDAGDHRRSRRGAAGGRPCGRLVVEADRAQLSEIVQRVRDGRLGRTSAPSRPSTTPLPLSTRPSGSREDDHPRSSIGTRRADWFCSSDRIPSLRTRLVGLYLANTSQIYPEDRGTNSSMRLCNVVVDPVRQDIGKPRQDAAHSS